MIITARTARFAVVHAAVLIDPGAVVALDSVARILAVLGELAVVGDLLVMDALGAAAAPGPDPVIVLLAGEVGVAIVVDGAGAAGLALAPGVVAPAILAGHLAAGRGEPAETGVVGGRAVAVIKPAVEAEYGPRRGAAVEQHTVVTTAAADSLLVGILAGIIAAALVRVGHPGIAAARGHAGGVGLVGIVPGAAGAEGFLSARPESVALVLHLAGAGVIDAVVAGIAAGLGVGTAVAVIAAVVAAQGMLARVIAAAGGLAQLAADVPGVPAGGAVGGGRVGIVPDAKAAISPLAGEVMAAPAVLAVAGGADAGRIGDAAGVGRGAGAAGAAGGAGVADAHIFIGVVAAALALGRIAADVPAVAAGRAIGRRLVGILPDAAVAVALGAGEAVALAAVLAGAGLVDAVGIGQAAGDLVAAAGAAGRARIAGFLELVCIVAAALVGRRLTADVPVEVAAVAIELGFIGVDRVVLAGAAGAALHVEETIGTGGVAEIAAAVVLHPVAGGADPPASGIVAVRRRGSIVEEVSVMDALVGVGAPISHTVIIGLAMARGAVRGHAAGAAVIALAPGIVGPAVLAAHGGAGQLVGAEIGIVARDAVAVVELAVVAENRAGGGPAGQLAAIVAAAVSRPQLLEVLAGVIAAALGRGDQPLEAAARGLAIGLRLIGTPPGSAIAVGLLAAEGVAAAMVLAIAVVVHAVAIGLAAGLGVVSAGAVFGAVGAGLGIFTRIIAAAVIGRGFAAQAPGFTAARAVVLIQVGILLLIQATAGGTALQVIAAPRTGGVAIIEPAVYGGPTAGRTEPLVGRIHAIGRRSAFIIQSGVMDALVGVGAPGTAAVVVGLAVGGGAVSAGAAGAAVLGQAPGIVAPAIGASHLGAGRHMGSQSGVIGGHAIAVVEQAIGTEYGTRGAAIGQDDAVIAAAVAGA